MASPYLIKVHDWKIREIVVDFIEAKALFEKYYKHDKSQKLIPFNILRKLCDMLYITKENYHLLFRNLIDPKKLIFEDANKFTPQENEINLMNTIGLLFHKIMVARELKYMIDYYEEDTRNYQESLLSLHGHLLRIYDLFNQGIDDLKVMLRGHKGNIYLTTFFLENSEFCVQQFNQDLPELMRLVSKPNGIEKALIDAAKFYEESGWPEKSRLMCNRCLELFPDNNDAKTILKRL
ncbi:hypothetical protein JXB12_11825 [candidate division KSB1 bacterium]|nr:hypothetical protein [candidate division KSB1 bacterium]